MTLASKVIKGHVLLGNAPIITHFENGGIHHRRPTEVEFDFFGLFVFAQVVINKRLVYKTQETIAVPIIQTLTDLPIIFWKWLGENHMKTKIRKLLFDGPELVYVKEFALGTATVPITHLATGFEGMKKVENMGPQRSHTGTTTDVDHFFLGILDEEFTVRT